MKLFTPTESYHWLRTLWEHHRNMRLTREALLALQLRKFRRIVAHAEKHSPYYREVIREHGIDPQTCVPTDFPVLTKRQVIEHFDEIVTDKRITRRRIADFLAKSTDPADLFEGRFHVVHTSGTSGTVGYFVFSNEAWIKGASHVVRVTPLGWRKRTAFVAATKGHFAGSSLMATGNRGSNRFFFDVRTFDVGQPLPQILAGLNKFQPHALSGYAGMLKVLAEAKERGELRINPHHLGNGGEPLLPELKKYLERIFGVPVLNAYASSEHLYMGLTLPHADGMVLMEDELIFEMKDDHTCVTNLFNELMPLIRYRMDDVLVPDETGANPYPFTKVKDVVGRYEDALLFTNEHGKTDFIHPIVIVELIIKGLNAWQIVLESRTAFRFRARYEQGLTEQERIETRERIRTRMRGLLEEKEMSNVRFEIEKVESFALDPKSGKFRLVVHEGEARNGSTPPAPGGAVLQPSETPVPV
jgi:phenylacetate-CoA ligase